jgi:trimeric autotransporter adhesin
MACMIQIAESFDQDISFWDVSNVKYILCMLFDTKSVNQDLSSWITGSAKTMDGMFGAISFNQDLS